MFAETNGWAGIHLVKKKPEAHRGPTRIGLCGYMGAGKDAAAALLSMLGYQRFAFADQVRLEVEHAILEGYVPREALGYALIGRDLSTATPDEVWAKPTSERMRRILQWWGAEYRRTQDADYWIEAAIITAVAIPLAVFTDVRFPNEVAAVREMGGVIWRIERPVVQAGIPGHVSELNVASIVPDRVIDNTGTLIDLARNLQEALKG